MHVSRTWLLRVLSIVMLMVGIVVSSRPGAIEASHDGRFAWTNYFVNAFIEDIPNTPLALVRVADCETQVHYHATIITQAVARWNATNRVRFVYDGAQPTVPCDSEGFPTVGNVVSVQHNSAVPTGDYDRHQNFDPSFSNDWGPESAPGSTGMYPLLEGRVRLGDNYDTTQGLTHELGHAAGLADLYSGTPCVNDNPYGGETVMDCTMDHNPIPQVIDIDSLNLMYQRIPQTTTLNSNPSVTYNSITLTWTDFSFNEKDQIITRVSPSATQTAPRNAQSWTWTGLNSSTQYCFNIKQRNAYGGTAAASPDVCATTAASPFDLQATDYSPNKPAASNGTTTINEGTAATQFTLSVKNNGSQTSPSSWVKIQFGGADPPSGGICNIPSIGAGVTATCLTGAVSWNFSGGALTVLADYNGLVPESNEGNNNYAWGNIGVKPTKPKSVRICSVPCGLFGYDDESGIETGFGIIIEKRTTSCSSGTWRVYDQFLHPAKNGTDDVYAYSFPSGAFRIKVQALGAPPLLIHSTTVTSSCVFFP